MMTMADGQIAIILAKKWLQIEEEPIDRQTNKQINRQMDEENRQMKGVEK